MVAVYASHGALATVSVFASGLLVGALLVKWVERLQRHRALTSTALPDVQDFASLRHASSMATQVVTTYLQDLYARDDPEDGRPCLRHTVFPKLQPGELIKALPPQAPQESESWQTIFDDLQRLIIPNLAHWQSPNFFSFIKLFAPESSLIGEFVAAAFNQNGFTWVASPAGTELEQVMSEWMRQLFGFPDCFSFEHRGGGIINSTATEGGLSALISARNQQLDGLQGEARAQQAGKLVVYCSDQTHCMVEKNCLALDVPNLRVLPTSRGQADEQNYALSPELLAKAMQEDIDAGLVPCLVMATIGTTATAAVDPIAAIARAAREVKSDIWIHIDGAFGGSAAVCPELQKWFEGVGDCDSINVNAHKSFLVSNDCSFLWVKQAKRLTSAVSVNPEYLKTAKPDGLNYKDWQVQMGRRFRSLKVWFHLRRMGIQGMQLHIRQAIQFAHKLERLLLADGRFALFVPARMALVTFYVADQPREITEQLKERVNTSGRMFLNHSIVDGRYFLRLAVGGLEQTDYNIERAVKVLSQELDNLLSKSQEHCQ